MKLKSLNCNFLSENDIKKLNLANIQTSEQLLAYGDLDSLSNLTKIPVKHLKLIKKFIIGQYSPFPEQANQLFDKQSRRLFIIETGSKNMDHLISNGIYSNEITLLNGESSSGKTQFCLNLVANAFFKNSTFNCLYVDSSKNFCAQKVHHLIFNKLETNYGSNDSQYLIKKSEAEKYLKSIKVLDCSNVFHLLDILFKITKSSTTPVSSETTKSECLTTNLLIIDDISTLFNQFKCHFNLDSFYYMSYVANYLKYLAANMNMSIIIVSNDCENSNKSFIFTSPAWTTVPNLILNFKFLDADENDNNSIQANRKLEVVKINRPFVNYESSFLTNKYCYFTINNNGII